MYLQRILHNTLGPLLTGEGHLLARLGQAVARGEGRDGAGVASRLGAQGGGGGPEGHHRGGGLDWEGLANGPIQSNHPTWLPRQSIDGGRWGVAMGEANSTHLEGPWRPQFASRAAWRV